MSITNILRNIIKEMDENGNSEYEFKKGNLRIFVKRKATKMTENKNFPDDRRVGVKTPHSEEIINIRQRIEEIQNKIQAKPEEEALR